MEQFRAARERPSGRDGYCEDCFAVRSTASYARRIRQIHDRDVRSVREVPDGHRYCPDCGLIKPMTDFPRNRGDRAGYAAYCTSCSLARGVPVSDRSSAGPREKSAPRWYGGGQRVEFDEMLAAQEGRCAICGAADPQHLDRDHRTGWVRGILCFNCNGGLGQFRESPELLAGAITYLKGTTWQRVLIHPGVFQMCSPMRGRPPSRSS
jgi:Recombination endonuclease VII